MAGLALGGVRPLDGSGETRAFSLPAADLTTHAVVVGMTGSGKTGLVMVLVEEALRASIPVLMIDVKGDLPNLLLTFPGMSAAEFEPWTGPERAEATARDWQQQLAGWRLGLADVAAFRARVAARVFTPGTLAAEPLHILSALEHASPLWATDVEVARETLSATISLLLRLMGRDPDPTRSRDHVVLSVFAERRLREGQPAGVVELLADVRDPPLSTLGALPINEFLPKRERQALAGALNTLLASPTFESWRNGAPLDVAQWMAPRADGRTSAVIVSVAHLDQDERSLVLGVVLDQFLAWTRTLTGTSELRALLVFDEIYGYVPPHPANPPAKRAIVSLMKQARAFGVGVVLATQNPMDLDYRALSNAGLWFVGRLQTDADRERVVEAMAGRDGRALTEVVRVLAPRWFVLRSPRHPGHPLLLQSRTTLSWLKGPLTRGDLRRLRGEGQERTGTFSNDTGSIPW